MLILPCGTPAVSQTWHRRGSVLGFTALLVVGGLSFLLQAAVKHTLALDLANLQGQVAEEILAHTYLSLVAAVFLPFLALRILQQLKTKNV